MDMTIQTNVRLPARLKKEAEKLVRKGYYKSVSELIVSSLRNEIMNFKKTAKALKDIEEVRKAREEVLTDFMRKAGGDTNKALKLMQEEAEKIYKKEPEFWE